MTAAAKKTATAAKKTAPAKKAATETTAEVVPSSHYDCDRCGARFGVAGTPGPDDDGSADEYFDEEVRRHEAGECVPVEPSRPNDLAQARIACQSRSYDSPEFATAWSTLALAEEQRTANLIAVLGLDQAAWANLYAAGAGDEAADDIAQLVVERLGLA